MFYICQLRDGFMLAQEKRGMYKVVETGYPYMDTNLPSQTMLNSLLRHFNIYDSAKVRTIEELADALKPVFGLDKAMTANELKSILAYGILPFEVEDSLYKVFDCKYFEIYQVYGYRTKEVLRDLKNREYNSPSYNFLNFNHAYILHSRAKNNEVLFEDASLSTDTDNVRYFIKELEKRIGLSISDFKLILDTIYDKIIETGFYFLCDEEDEIEILPDVTNGGTSSPIEATATVRWLLSWFNPWKEYCKHSNMDSAIKRALEELEGCNLFNRVNYRYFGGETVALGLLLCYYGVADKSEKERVKEYIKDLIISTTNRLGLTSSDLFYGVENDNIVLLMSPYTKYNEISNVTHNLLSKIKDIHIRKMPNGEDMCALSMGMTVTLKTLTDVENRWLQYFVLRDFAYIMNCKVQYCDLNIEEWYSKAAVPDVKFTLRDSLKAIQPNFDRLFMMGAYESVSMETVASNVYNYTRYENSVFDSNYLPALEFAMQGQSEFTFSEKAFLLGFVNTIDAEYDGSERYFHFCIFHKRYGEKLAPVLSDEFIEKLKVVFKMYIIAYRLTEPAYQLATFRFEFLYKNYVFECKLV